MIKYLYLFAEISARDIALCYRILLCPLINATERCFEWNELIRLRDNYRTVNCRTTRLAARHNEIILIPYSSYRLPFATLLPPRHLLARSFLNCKANPRQRDSFLQSKLIRRTSGLGVTEVKSFTAKPLVNHASFKRF